MASTSGSHYAAQIDWRGSESQEATAMEASHGTKSVDGHSAHSGAVSAVIVEGIRPYRFADQLVRY